MSENNDGVVESVEYLATVLIGAMVCLCEHEHVELVDDAGLSVFVLAVALFHVACRARLGHASVRRCIMSGRRAVYATGCRIRCLHWQLANSTSACACLCCQQLVLC